VRKYIMKKRQVLLLAAALSVTTALASCGKKDETPEVTEPPVIDMDPGSSAEEEEPGTSAVEEETRDGMVRNPLTNEWIDEALKDQRPIALMVDNDKRATPHYGLSQVDILYEMTNSTKNSGITRLMPIIKDWEGIKQIGSMRSARPSNLTIMPEWNAVFFYFGGPFYIDDYIAKDYVDSVDGNKDSDCFMRVNNGKPSEFTAYGHGEGFAKGFEKKGYSRTYNEYYEGAHYQFASESSPVELTADQGAENASRIDLAFALNKPYFEYNESDGLYYRFQYGEKHIDAENNSQLAFKNLLIQNTRYEELDDNGYMAFYTIDDKMDGYYVTNGKAIHITWKKTDACSPTRYFDDNGKEIVLNTGKTYVALVPNDIFKNNKIQ
jgi:hypothetical protein